MHVALRVPRKVELSSAPPNVVKQGAACELSIANWNAICENEPIRTRLMLTEDFKPAAGERVVSNFQCFNKVTFNKTEPLFTGFH